MTQPDPAIPTFAIRAGPWRAEVFDPRPDPAALGVRYVQGGYVKALWYGDRCLTGCASPAWDPYVGMGLPDVFELPLGGALAGDGEEVMRIGAARVRRSGRAVPARGAPSTPLTWSVALQTTDTLVMRCGDAVRYGGTAIGYELERTVHLDAAGLVCTTALRLDVPWSHPVAWFAHPFVAHTGGDRTGFRLPAGSVADAAVTFDTDGLARLPAAGGLGNVTGLWGRDDRAVDCMLDPELGGGAFTIRLDKPMDHLVLYSSVTAASPEPQLARTWKKAELSEWTIAYGFTPGPGARDRGAT